MSSIIEVTTTLETQEQCKELAAKLIEKRLAACVQITGPIESVYHWQGQVCTDQEFRCTAKSIKALSDRIFDFMAEAHPYEVPEVLVVDVSDCSESYAKWLCEQVAES